MKDFFQLDVRPRTWRRAHIIDVTLRDGGFRNHFGWSFDDMITVAKSASSAGADCIELGYIGGVPELHGVQDPGPTANLTPSAIGRVREQLGAVRLCAMVHPSVVHPSAAHPSAAGASLPFEAYRSAGLDLVRIVYHEAWDALFFRLAGEAAAAGLATSANLALASRYERDEIVEKAERAAQFGVDIVCLADTCAALLPGEVEELIRSVSGFCSAGFHAHDFLSLALANGLAATAAGAAWIDASICGIGRGAGNLRLESWLALQLACTGSGAALSALIPALQMIEDRLGTQAIPDLASVVAGVLNLTPPQESQLRAQAKGGSVASAAATLMDNHRRADTVPGAFENAETPK